MLFTIFFLRMLIFLNQRRDPWKIDQSFELAVAIKESQTPATNCFIKVSAKNWCVAPLGININLTERHSHSLQWLLILSGSVELNPGPETCSECQKQFNQKKHMNEHVRLFHGLEKQCSNCDFKTKYPTNLKRHMERVHGATEPPLKKVNIQPSSTRLLASSGRPPVCKQSALKKRLATYRVDGDQIDPELFLERSVSKIETFVDTELKEKTGVKLQLVLALTFYMPLDLTEKIDRHFWSDPMPIYRGTEYNVEELFPPILKQIDEFQRQGSGWVINKLQYLDAHLVVCRPLKAGSFVDLPAKLMSTHAVLNIHNTDEKCFMYCIRAALENIPSDSNPNRITKYTNDHNLNFHGIDFPVDFNNITRFEKQNPSISVNVYGFEEEVFPYRISPRQTGQVVHLLLYNNHYFLIRSLDRLLSHLTKHNGHLWFCHRCLIHRSSEALLKNHTELCKKTDPSRVKMSEENSTLKFNSIHKTLRQPLVIYADLETLQKKVSSPDASSQTENLREHVPCGYGLQVVRNCCGNPVYDNPEVYRGADCIEKFLISLSQLAIDYQNSIRFPAAMKDVNADSNECHICKKQIEDKKVRDHCHLCGKFRGVAHNECNQAYRLSRDIVVIFHNLRKYDGHLLMDKLGTIAKLQGFDIDVVAKAMEDYISFSLVHRKEPGVSDRTYRIKFIDSALFLNSSLADLVDNLPTEKFHVLENQKDLTSYQKQLLRRKGIYPYDYMDSWEKFSSCLPNQTDFYNILTNEELSSDDYCHAQNVWSEFQIKNMGNYHDLYLRTDVMLLADVFEEFRNFSIITYGLDPTHYITTPSLAFDSCLKMTNVNLELFSDIDMYLFCEQAIKGGLSVISHRYAEANNPYIKETYDPKKEHSYIIFFDANNLYGWVMAKVKIAIGQFKWITDKIKLLTTNWFEDKDIGYILEVDLEYPKDLHQKHNDYPLAPEHLELTTFSKYTEYLREKLGLKIGKYKKLVPNLFNKNNYIVHHRNLKLYLDLGMRITKIHRVLQFKQAAWMESYVMKNTELRKNAKTKFEKDLFKLFNNSVFGKCLENPRCYKNIQLVSTGTRFEKLTASPRYRNCCRFNEDLVGVSMLRSTVTLNKPIYVGFTILDVSKELMYKFHYNVMLPKYGERLKLLMTDTDSLCYHVKTDDIYKDMLTMKDQFDFSDYPTEHFLHSTVNKKKLGYMKDETNGLPIESFCGLRSKMYSLRYGGIDKKRAKGIKKSVVKNVIKHEDFLDTLFNEDMMKHQMVMFRSGKHRIHTVKLTKTSLSAYDDKRWLINPIETTARGHYLNFDYNA